MKTALELKEERAGLLEQIEQIDTKADAEKRNLTEDEQSKWDDLVKRADDLKTEIARAEKREEMARERALDKAHANEKKGEKSEKREATKQYSLLKAINEQMRNGQLTGLEKEMHEEAEQEVRQFGSIGGFGLPSWAVQLEKRDLTAGTTTTGGHTIQTDVGALIPILRPNLVCVNAGAQVLSGLTGNLDLPRNDAKGAAVWEGENDANAETTPTFDKLSLSPNRLGAYTQISKQLMVQSTLPSVEAFVRNDLTRAVQEKLDQTLLQGNAGGSDPFNGILNTTGIGAVFAGGAPLNTTNANGAAPIWADVINLYKEVDIDNAALGALSYVSHPSTVAYFSRTPKQASGVEGNFIMPTRDELYGFPMRTTTQLSDITKGSSTDLKAIIFGNFNDMIIGQWAGVDIVVDPYSSSKNALVDIVVNTWWDMVIRHAESFASCEDADVA